MLATALYISGQLIASKKEEIFHLRLNSKTVFLLQFTFFEMDEPCKDVPCSSGAIKKQITAAQKVTLIEFVESNPELVSQKHSNQHTNASARRLWQKIAVKLNSISGASKTWEEWRKVCEYLLKMYIIIYN